MTRIVLVHGAFAGAWCWEPVLPGLRAAGHHVEAIDLPGGGEDHTPLAEITLDAYADRVCQALARDPAEPALLAGHSMGGMAVTQAAARCPEHILGLVYVAAFLPQDGESLLAITEMPEAAGDQVQANIVVDGDPPLATLPADLAPRTLFNACTPEQERWGVAHLRPQPVIPFTQPFRRGDAGAAFDRLPRAYITSLRDHAIQPAAQRLLYTRAGCDPVIEIDTDHSAWASRPDELVAALNRVAAAFGS